MNDVVVTGIGLVTGLGLGREKTWRAVKSGSSAIKPDVLCPGFLSARVEDIMPPQETRLLSMAFFAAAEALHDSQIELFRIPADRRGCTVNVSKPYLNSSYENNIAVNDLFMPSALGHQLARIFKLYGPVRNIAAACATGTNAIILASQWIRHGICDMVLAGAVESSLHPLYQAGFGHMGVLAREKVCPFDKKREGFAIGEGAGVVVLERKDLAVLRHAAIYGQISGWAMANDATHPVAFGSSGGSIAAAITTALKHVGNKRVDYINAHGTGTRLNDVVETRALRKVFGKNASKIAISSTKAATGHLLGASGAVEFALSLLAMRDGIIPPTLNLNDPDPECDLDYTPLLALRKNIDNVMSLSFGFGGQIGIITAARE